MLKQDIEQGVKEALKSGDQMRLSTLRFLLSAVKNEEILRQREATDEDVILVVQRQINQHKEAIEAYQKAGRSELEQKEKQELEILQQFLPKQLSEEEIREIVKEVVNGLPESDKNNFGRVMGQVMARVKGMISGNTVAEIVKKTLTQGELKT